MAGCSSWAAVPAMSPTWPHLRGVVRPATPGPGPRPGACSSPHGGFAATLLRDGRVLVGDADDPGALDPIFGAEVYDPDERDVDPDRDGWSRPIRGLATLLRDGRVLVTGSDGTSSQLYDPDSGTWTATGKMLTLEPSPRGHPAARWQGARGGRLRCSNDHGSDLRRALRPRHGDMDRDRADARSQGQHHGHAAARWQGARCGCGRLCARATPPELYDPATGTWTATGDLARPGHRYGSATLLSDGTVLVTGDRNSADAEVYDPGTAVLDHHRDHARAHPWRSPATLLLDGTVLVAGGSECSPDSAGVGA